MSATAPVQLRKAMGDLLSSDRERQDHAFQSLTGMTTAPVAWAYEVWDDLLRLATRGDNRQRAIAGQLLCNLAQSDPQARILEDIGLLFTLTKDDRFVTARHCLLSLWKVATTGDLQRKKIVDGLVARFKECASEKNCTLIRYDIQCVLKRIHEHAGDPSLRSIADALINLETDEKYRKKYNSVWRGLAHTPHTLR